MPLTRANLTSASRIMLPWYPIASGWIGVAYIVGDSKRTESPSLEAVKWLMPIPAWGVVFLLMTALLLAGYVMRSREVTIFVLCMAAAGYELWSLAFWVAIFTVPDASLVAPMWPMSLAVACYASSRSIANREVSRI